MKTKYPAIRLRYGIWLRHRDRSNGRRDRRKDIDNYRYNKTTKYMDLIKAEMEFRLNREQGRYGIVRSQQQRMVDRAEQVVSEFQQAHNELLTRLEQLESQHKVLKDDYIRRASIERQISDLNAQIVASDLRLSKLKQQHKTEQSIADNIDKTYRNNCTVIRAWADARVQLYVDTLFKKVDRDKEAK